MTAVWAPSTPSHVLDDAVAHLAPVSLDELVTEAALLTRIDRKYVVPLPDLSSLVEGIPDTSKLLQISGRQVFGYRSVYLDTRYFTTYREAGVGRRLRAKVRTRAYLDTNTCWLEVKTRSGREATIKERIPHPDAEFAGLTDEGRAFVDHQFATHRIRGLRSRDLIPVVVTSYSRATVLLPNPAGPASRVTIDVDLGWTSLLRTSARADVERPALAIVETKSGVTPSAVDRLLWRAGHRPRRVSKYAVGAAVLNPELPRLKWARTYRRDFGLRPHQEHP